MKLKPIPDPVLGPYQRRQKPSLKPLIAITLPKPSLEPETKTKNSTSTETPKNKPVETSTSISTSKPEESPILGVAEDGTKIPLPFKPVDPLTALSAPNPTVAFVMLRQLKDMRGPMPDTSNGALAVLDKLETGLKTGQDVSTLNDEISVHIAGEEEHNELFSRLQNSIDRDRATEIFKSRAKWEDFCHACMRRGDLSIVEGMAMMSYFNSQLTNIFSRMDRKQKNKADASMTRDTQDLVEKVNRPTLLKNKHLQRKFDEAPPQEREILRKIGFKLENALAARITKTTETVEIIQHGS